MYDFAISDYLQDRDGYRGICKVCYKYVGWSKEKLASHKRLSCASIDEESKRFFSKRHPDVKVKFNFNVANDFIDPECSSCKLTEEKINLINSKLASLILCTGIPLHIVKSHEFKEFVTSLNSTYADVMPGENSPSSSSHSKTPSEQQDVKCLSILKSSDNLTLISDGWNNIKGDHIVNFSVKAPSQKPFFYDSINTSRKTQTPQTVANEIITVLKQIGPEKFTSVITDYDPVMKDVWKLIETKFPHISANGCVAHGMNLLIKDVLETDKNGNTLENSEKIIKFVTSHHIVKAKYEERLIAENIPHTLVTPEPARWLSRYSSLNNLMASKQLLITLVDEESEALEQIAPKQTSETVLNIIKSDNFWSNLYNLLKLVDYPANIIGKLEEDDSERSSIYRYFCDIYPC